MGINIGGKKKKVTSMKKIVTKGGKEVPEAHAPGVRWFPIQFRKEMRIPWNWNDLLQDATKAGENLNLAIAGLILSAKVEVSSRVGEAVLRQLGFNNIESHHYFLSTSTKNGVSNPGRTFGYKKLEKDGKKYHVICAVFKGTTTVHDYITDRKAKYDGFYDAGKNCVNSLKKYMEGIKGAVKDNTILFITGHSLGAATANVVGRLSREYVNDKRIFVYTYASPNYETEGEWKDGKTYSNFHCFTNVDDGITTVPKTKAPRYFAKIGEEHLFNYNELEKDQKKRFGRVYEYIKEETFEEDKYFFGVPLRKMESSTHKAYKNHISRTYLSFILSELSDREIDNFLLV